MPLQRYLVRVWVVRMTTVTKESLAVRIAELEAGPRSLKEDFYLAVMNDLLDRMVDDAEWADKFHMESDDD